MSMAPTDTLQLLADENRWSLVQQLTRSDRTVGELTELVDKPQNLVSYHLANLREAGIVSSRRSSADGRDTYYRIQQRRTAELLSDIGAALQLGLRVDGRPPLPVQRRSKPRVLFLCTGNSARSQMAQAFVEAMSDGVVTARSAGSHPKPVHPNAVRVMAERGIDIADRSSKILDPFTRERFDRVITLCDKVREVCPEFPKASWTAHWSMADPAADTARYEAFVRTADELEERIPFLIRELTTERRT